jgi:pimeloyl-ACP methyl ester carboxylesterase
MEKKIISDKITINYDVFKANKTANSKDLFLVFIHGAGGDLNVWKKERTFFHKIGISTLAIDLRGHGKSEKPEDKSKYQLSYFVKDISKIINAEKIRKFVMVGHCLGGIITILFHKYYPNQAKSYILINSTYEAPISLKRIFKYNPINVEMLGNIFKYSKKYGPLSHVDHERFAKTKDLDPLRIYSDITNTSFRSWLFTYENISKYNEIETVKKINQPTLIIQGDKDIVFNTNIAKKLHNLIRNSTLKIIREENHIIVLNNPDVINKEIMLFLKDNKLIELVIR